MTITLTSLSKSQWGKVWHVLLWLFVSSLCALVAVWLTSNPLWLLSQPGWNVLGVILQGIVTQEEANALSNLDPAVQQDVQTTTAVITKDVQDVVAVLPPTVPPSAPEVGV